MVFSLTSVRRAETAAALLATLMLTIFGGILPARSHAQGRPGHEHHPTKPAPLIERSPDAYKIYSLLMPGQALASMAPGLNQRWAIAETTVSARDISPALAPEAALRAPEKNAKGFREAVSSYEAHKDERMLLLREFHLDRPYTLLTPAEVDEFRAARSSATAPAALRAKYSGYPGITYFSPVFFDSNHTSALVYIVDWCGNLCAGGEWVYLEKQDDKWVRRSGRP